MMFIMYPFGSKYAIVTDDYSGEEYFLNRHIEDLRADVEYFGLKYPCKVYTGDMRPYGMLYADKFERVKNFPNKPKKRRRA